MCIACILELVTVIGSGSLDKDEYIKRYLRVPHTLLTTAVKIELRYFISADSILQLGGLRECLNTPSYEVFVNTIPELKPI